MGRFLYAFGRSRGLALIGFAAWMLLRTSSGEAQPSGQETVYRITIVRDLAQDQALDFKVRLEGLGYLPINLESNGDKINVLYGNFRNHAEALRARVQLEAEGFRPESIVQVTRGGAVAAAQQGAGLMPTFRVLVGRFYDVREADKLKQTLEQKGHLYVESSANGGIIEVTVGRYPDRNSAQKVLLQLREEGYVTADIQESGGRAALPPPGSSLPRPPGATDPRPAPPAAGPAELKTIDDLPAVTQTDLWKQLSPDQQREALKTVMLQDKIRQGDVVAQRLIDIEKRLQNLDDKTRKVVDEITKERQEKAQTTSTIQTLFKDAESLAAGKRYEDAIVNLRKILEIDPSNQLARNRIRAIEALMRGESYEGQSDEKKANYASLKAAAEEAKRQDTRDSLNTAIAIWTQIKTIDPKYVKEAEGTITTLRGTLNAKIDQEKNVDKQYQDQQKKLGMALGGAIGFLTLVIAFIAFRARKRHRELITKIHEITQIRPMRELEGGGGGRLALAGAGGPPMGGSDAETELFSPMSQPGDPLADMPPTRKTPPPAPKPAAPAKTAAPTAFATGEDSMGGFDNLFGEDSSPSAPASGKADTKGEPAPTEKSEFDMDELFSDSAPSAPPAPKAGPKAPAKPAAKPSAPAPQESSDISFDDVFADLPSVDDSKPLVTASSSSIPVSSAENTANFAMDDLFAPEPKTKPKPAQSAPKQAAELSAISFGDILGEDSKVAEAPPAAKSPADTDDPLSLFADSTSGGGPVPPPKPAPPHRPAPPPAAEADPFEALFGDTKSGEAPPPTTNAPPTKTSAPVPPKVVASPAPAIDETDFPTIIEDDTEIPAIRLETPDDDPFANLIGGSGPSHGGDVANLMASPKGSNTTVIPSTPPPDGVIFMQNFEQDATGQPPPNWAGQYDYATLLVRDDNPPKGTKKYLCYQKKDGTGKAYYSVKFPNTAGTLSVEFDLRCNDKNKFLLGFYIEKDEDFQQSVHTKILRSEAQTAPTIHIQGEPAPYLLGSWAHIKYLINLTEGKVDGYIDSTHIARGLKLPQVPKYLNTLAIRDNVNTTGDLLIANIQVRKIS